ncbi:MAG: polyprenyl synthetase family protein [Akkermansia sp.]
MIQEYIHACIDQVDRELDRLLPSEEVSPVTIHRAMRYSIFAGGKRLRPVLCLAAAEACGGNREDALLPACSVEVMHTYSLIHDDLPGMDNDDLRRGKPTSHKVFGEGIAILAGDALLTESFSILVQVKPTTRYSVKDFMQELATTGDSCHLIGGQVLDLEGEQKKLTESELRAIHEGKTAALLTAALRLGGMSANATPEELEALTQFGYHLGLAFQVIDDILDITASTEDMGKTVGKDERAEKSTYPALLGLAGAQREADRLTTAALDALSVFSPHHRTQLEQLANHLLHRTN